MADKHQRISCTSSVHVKHLSQQEDFQIDVLWNTFGSHKHDVYDVSRKIQSCDTHLCDIRWESKFIAVFGDQQTQHVLCTSKVTLSQNTLNFVANGERKKPFFYLASGDESCWLRGKQESVLIGVNPFWPRQLGFWQGHSQLLKPPLHEKIHQHYC